MNTKQAETYLATQTVLDAKRTAIKALIAAQDLEDPREWIALADKVLSVFAIRFATCLPESADPEPSLEGLVDAYFGGAPNASSPEPDNADPGYAMPVVHNIEKERLRRKLADRIQAGEDPSTFVRRHSGVPDKNRLERLKEQEATRRLMDVGKSLGVDLSQNPYPEIDLG